MSGTDGARVEIVESDHDPGTGVLATAVRVNGTDVGTLAKPPKVDTGDGNTRMTTVTLVLVPCVVEIKGDDVTATRNAIGFTAE